MKIELERKEFEKMAEVMLRDKFKSIISDDHDVSITIKSYGEVVVDIIPKEEEEA